MKRKTKRTGKKKMVAILASIGAIVASVVFTYTVFKDSIIPNLILHIKTWFELEDKSTLPFFILYVFLIATIALLSLLISRKILNYNKPNKKYFELIDFERPTDKIIKKAVEGILNSEKTQPYFVHVAPISDEVEQLYQKLYEKGFVWENGKPGDGKTMLAYHALYRYRKRIGFSYRYSIRLFWLKYRIYKLNLNHINDEKEVDLIHDELDSLKGGRRKIVLIDDAHKLNFEDKLRFEFEEEAKEKSNGKFVWINTNYLEASNSDSTDSFNIDFENFYPKLIEGLYKSQNSIVKEIIKKKCTGLQDAIKLKEQGRIKDPWHFNFVASNGEQRIIQLLEKLSRKKAEQDILLLSVFLFSVRNIMTGEKEFNQTEFTVLLSKIDIPYFEKNIEIYQPNKIISDLGSQEKGRFIIIENKNSIDRGFLHAPHARLSKAFIKAITIYITDKKLIEQLIDTSKLLLTNDYEDSKYFSIYFDLLGKYQEYFLNNNKVWITSFLYNLKLDQLHVYPFLLSILKKNHNSFYKKLINDDYFTAIASAISLAPATRFVSIQQFIQVLGNDKDKLVKNLNWETLANTANKAEVAQLNQVADFVNALGTSKEKTEFLQKLNLETLANAANKAEVAQLKQVANFINALGNSKEKTEFLKKVNWETLTNLANKVEVAQLNQVADFINALGTSKEKTEFLKKVNWETLANATNKAEVANFGQLEAILNALGNDKDKLIQKLNWETLANAANKAEVATFGQLEAILNALGNDKEKLVQKLNWEILANSTNKVEVAQLKQVADFINALGNDKEKLVQKLNWEKLANATNKAEVAQLKQVADFINALGKDKKKLSKFFEVEDIIVFSKNLDVNQIKSFCIILASLEIEKQNLVICECNWLDLLNKINLNHSENIKTLTYILYYLNKKHEISDLPIFNQEIIVYLENNKGKIVHFSTQYFISPDNFQSCSNLLGVLIPHSYEICLNIADKIKYKIASDFIITPRYYQSFSNLLNVFNQLNPTFSKYIISNDLVKLKLHASFDDKSINGQLKNLQSLLRSIKNIDTSATIEILGLKSIKDLKLDSTEKNSINENINDI